MPLTRTELIGRQLLAAQNADGGFPYRIGGSSWTEPTALAVLALHTLDPASPHVQKAVDWLRTLVRPDGGLSPSVSVRESSWVTALYLLVESVLGRASLSLPAVNWLIERTGEESRPLVRIRNFLLGYKPPEFEGAVGWPWLPGSAAWVMPTAWTIIALKHLSRRQSSAQFTTRLNLARRFLVVRQCADGGWNHGASRALGYEASSYPETTGIALLALKGETSDSVTKALARAKSMLSEQSNQATSWLALGLMAHDQTVMLGEGSSSLSGTMVDLAVELLARTSAVSSGVLG